MTSNIYNSYDFLNNYYSAKDSYNSHAYLVQIIEKTICLPFGTTNVSFYLMVQVKNDVGKVNFSSCATVTHRRYCVIIRLKKS